MAKLGCTVRAFDPNVEEHVQHPNIHFKKLGLSHNNGSLKNTAADGTVRQMPVLTLLDRELTKMMLRLKLPIIRIGPTEIF